MTETVLAVLSAILGVVNVVQWIIGYVSGNSLRAREGSALAQNR